MDAIRRLALLRNALSSATSPLVRQLFDVCATAAIVTTVVTLSAGSWSLAIARAQAAEALSLATSRMNDAAVTHAETGRWPEPSPSESSADLPASFVRRVDVGTNGRVHMQFEPDAHPRLRNRHATIEPVLLGGGATLTWRLTEDATLDGERLDAILMPHALQLDDKEP